MFNTFGRNQGHTVEGGEETGMRRNMRSQESEKTRSLPCHLFFLSLSLLWNSWTFFRNYWPLGSFWKILSLRVFILDAFEFSAFRDLWTLGDGRQQHGMLSKLHVKRKVLSKETWGSVPPLWPTQWCGKRVGWGSPSQYRQQEVQCLQKIQKH